MARQRGTEPDPSLEPGTDPAPDTDNNDPQASAAGNPATTETAPPLEQMFVVTQSAPGRELGLVHLAQGRPAGSEAWLRAATALDLALACGRYRTAL